MSKDTQAPVYRPKKLLQRGQELDKSIKTAKTAGDRNAKRIQLNLLSTAADLQSSRNMDYVHKVLDNIPLGVSKDALVDWFCKFAQVKRDDDSRNGVAFDRDRDIAKGQSMEFDQTAGENEPWWDFVPEKPYKGMDLLKALETLVKKGDKAADQDNPEKAALDNVPEALLRDLHKVLSQHQKVADNT